MNKIDTEVFQIGSSVIYCGSSVIAVFDKLISQYDKIFLLVDENTNQFCLPNIETSHDEFFSTKIIIPSGESNKTLATTQEIWNTFVEENANRRSLLVNLGGGTITDIGGFAASTFMRGIPFINVPTTLLAMIDASIGGKTGIDYKEFKNYIGTFQFPEAVFVIPALLESLDMRQRISGFAEMIKHAIVADSGLWNKILQSDKVDDLDTIIPLLHEAIQVKVDIVNRDFRESGERKKLNFGHTVGHAIESHYLKNGKPILHGEAVAIGMLVESLLSLQNKLLQHSGFKQIERVIRKTFSIPSMKGEDIDEILHLMQFDKKNHSNEIHFSIPVKIGECHTDKTFTLNKIQSALEEILLR
jgi:3-dehydroquinate synthase